jgi:hypothetical protein
MRVGRVIPSDLGAVGAVPCPCDVMPAQHMSLSLWKGACFVLGGILSRQVKRLFAHRLWKTAGGTVPWWPAGVIP